MAAEKNLSGNWSELQEELIDLCLEKLSFSGLFNFRAVCRSWRKATQNIAFSPVLMLPPPNEEANNKGCVCFFSLRDKNETKLKVEVQELKDSDNVGSSHGWLIFFDRKHRVRLVNPFASIRIQLPVNSNVEGCIEFGPKMWFNQAREGSEVRKAILSGNPSEDNNYGVIIIHGQKMFQQQSKLAHCGHKDGHWFDLEGVYEHYCDIICWKKQLYALANVGSVEAWDFSGLVPVKTMNITPPLPAKIQESEQRFPEDLHSTRWYLVESLGDILLVVRYIGDFVYHGEVVDGVEDRFDEYGNPVVCPYKTLHFQVYKMDVDQEQWLELESLGDRVLFVGGNHSISLSSREHPECKEDSIYFTDDDWDRMDEDWCYGGHDMGVFKLAEGIIEQFHPHALLKIQPPPFWIVPKF